MEREKHELVPSQTENGIIVFDKRKENWSPVEIRYDNEKKKRNKSKVVRSHPVEVGAFPSFVKSISNLDVVPVLSVTCQTVGQWECTHSILEMGLSTGVNFNSGPT